jgi:hypothetical protein
MFDKYLICDDGFQNIAKGDEIIGFRLNVRITYYRGVSLSAIEGFDVTVDGKSFPREHNLFSVRGRTYTFVELQEEGKERWELGEVAQLTVPLPGGLKPGPHIIEVLELLRISYLPALSEGLDKKTLILAG